MKTPEASRQASAVLRILVRGTNWLGDAVMTTPALLRLREKFPLAHIALLTPEKLNDLWMHHPAVNGTVSFASGGSSFSVGRKLRRWSEVTDQPAREDARPTGFDLALVFPNSPRSAIETWLAGIPQRIGYARPWRNFFLTRTVSARSDLVRMHKRSVAEIRQLVAADAGRRQTSESPVPTDPTTSSHQMHDYLHLVAALGANPEPLPPQLSILPDEIETAKKKYGLEQLTQPIFGLNPGAEYGPAKRWLVERFIAVAQRVQQRTGCLWLLFGAKNDAPIAQRIEFGLGGMPAVMNLTGRTSLRELMALLKICRVLLTNDSGPMHVAAALDTPVVVPFGSTSPELTGPGLPGDPRHHLLKSDTPCSPCFRRECPIDFRCMNGITVERVAAAVVSAQFR